MEHFTRNRGTNRGKPRLWIEGAHLLKAGFKPREKWSIVERKGGFDIVRDTEGKRTISGKDNRPIVDIIGAALGETVSKADSVNCSYKPGSGLIKVRVAS